MRNAKYRSNYLAPSRGLEADEIFVEEKGVEPVSLASLELFADLEVEENHALSRATIPLPLTL